MERDKKEIEIDCSMNRNRVEMELNYLKEILQEEKSINLDLKEVLINAKKTIEHLDKRLEQEINEKEYWKRLYFFS